MCFDIKYIYIHQIMFVFFSSAYKAAYSWNQWIRIYVKIIVVAPLLSLQLFFHSSPLPFFFFRHPLLLLYMSYYIYN